MADDYHSRRRKRIVKGLDDLHGAWEKLAVNDERLDLAEISRRLRAFFAGPFTRWAKAVVQEFGADAFPSDAEFPPRVSGTSRSEWLTGYPDDWEGIQPFGSAGATEAELQLHLTGVADDPVDSGLRLIHWGAVDRFGSTVDSWNKAGLSIWLWMFCPSAQSPQTVVKSPFSWVETAFEYLVRREPHQVQPISQPQHAAGQTDEQPPDHIFRLDGGTYEIQAFGQQGHFKESVGLKYLHKLLARHPALISYRELVAETGTREQLADRLESNQVDHDDEAEEVKGGREGSSDPVLDDQGRKELQAHAETLRSRLNRPETAKDPKSEVERRELGQIEQALASARGLGGRPREFLKERDKLRPSITQALTRAYEKLRKGSCGRIADHLETNVSSKEGYLYYQPGQPIEWTTS